MVQIRDIPLNPGRVATLKVGPTVLSERQREFTLKLLHVAAQNKCFSQNKESASVVSCTIIY